MALSAVDAIKVVAKMALFSSPIYSSYVSLRLSCRLYMGTGLDVVVQVVDEDEEDSVGSV